MYSIERAGSQSVQRANLHGRIEQRRFDHTMVAVDDVIVRWSECRQTEKVHKAVQRAQCVAAPDLGLAVGIRSGLYLVEQHGKGVQKRILVEVLGVRRIAVTTKQIQCERKGLLNEA